MFRRLPAGAKKIKQIFVFLLAAVLVLSMAPSVNSAGHSIPSGWAQQDVERAISLGLVPASLQTRYKEPISRAGFCALAVRVYEIGLGRNITLRKAFSDTSDVNVQKMGGLGVIDGRGNNVFAPDDSLSPQEATTIMSRQMGQLNITLVSSAPKFLDYSEIAEWARSSVGQMQANGIMGGTGNNRFSPRSSFSTEQGIVTMLKIYDMAIEIRFEEIGNADVPLGGFFDLDDGADLKRMAADVMALVNVERARVGRSALIGMELLNAAASVRAAECESLYSHTRPDGRDFASVLDDLELKARGVGETLDKGPKSADEVMRRWMDSSVHKECILIPDWEKMGVGVYRGDDGTLHWALLLIT